MAVDILLSLKNIKGESRIAEHEEEIDVLSWSWGCSQSASLHRGMGGGSGKADFTDLAITKYYDKSSPDLMKVLAKGTHIPEGKLTIRKAGDNPLEYFIMELKHIIVTSISTGGSGADDQLTENVTLNFREFKVKYTEQTMEGGEGDKPDFAWNIAENQEA